ncbi:hypothetical protein LT493_11970 [Streptomyces tricolor]|nr:hypothetical protein [Streptomyces tricolor]
MLKGKRITESVQIDLVRAAARIDSARHLVEQNASVIDDRAFRPNRTARNRRNASFAGEQAAEAVAALVRVAGTAGLSDSGDLQRFWRDVTTATSHVALRYDITRPRRTTARHLSNKPSDESRVHGRNPMLE